MQDNWHDEKLEASIKELAGILEKNNNETLLDLFEANALACVWREEELQRRYAFLVMRAIRIVLLARLETQKAAMAAALSHESPVDA
ncbi:MAG: hypothetical protein EXS55_04365 [Candidatus Magasanikbacteria bacterium]|nr:hypothetical protein [Candidatus Magasanikbacteria bacterium]